MRKLAIIAIIFIAIAAQPETAGSEQAPENPPEVLFFISQESGIVKQ